MISLKLPVCTHLGEGSVKVVPEIIRRENAKKVVVFTDQGVRQSGVCLLYTSPSPRDCS